MSSRLRNVLILLAISLLGCSVISPIESQAIEVYTLPPISSEAENKADNALVLALSPIHSSRALMSSDIIYRDSEYGYNSYAYSRWSDSPTKLLEMVLQQTLSNQHYISAVIPREMSQADLTLESTLVDFSHYIQSDEKSTGRVELRCFLIDAQTKTVLMSKAFSAEVNAEPRNAQGASTALNVASRKLVGDVAIWVGEYLASSLEK